MTKEGLSKLIDNLPNKSWQDNFSRKEFETIVTSMYKEYRDYSVIDAGFGMYLSAALGVMLTNGAPETIREKYLKVK